MAGATSRDLVIGVLSEEFALAHFGVKGMKWGVVRSRASSAAATVDQKKVASKVAQAVASKVASGSFKPSADAVSAKKYMTRVQLDGVKNLSNKEMQHVIRRMELEQRYRDLYGEHQLYDAGTARAKRWAKKGARWAARFSEDVGKDVASSWLSNPFASGGGSAGRGSPTAYTWGQQFSSAIEAPPSRRAIGR